MLNSTSTLEYLKNHRIVLFFLAVSALIEVSISVIIGLELLEVLAVSLLVIFSLLVFIEPKYGLFLIIFVSFGLEGQYIAEFVLFKLFGFNWYLMDLSLVILFLSIIPRVFSGVYKLTINYAGAWLFLFLFTALVASVWGIKNGNSSSDVFFDLRGFFYYISFLPTILILQDSTIIKKFFVFVIGLGVLKSLVDIFLSIFVLQKTFDPNTMEYLSFARLQGYNEIVYPITFIMSVVYAIMHKSFKVKALLAFPILISGFALFLSYTRGSWLAVFLSLIILYILLSRSKEINISFTSIFAIIFGVLFLVFILNILNVFSTEQLISRIFSVSSSKIDSSNLGRLVEYVTALEAFIKNPLLGAGLGHTFDYFAPSIGYKSTIYCHNSYLYVLSKMGIMGFIPFLVLIIILVRVSYLSVVKNTINSETSIVFTFAIVLILISIKSLTTWHLNVHTFSLFVGFLFGVLINYITVLEEN